MDVLVCLTVISRQPATYPADSRYSISVCRKKEWTSQGWRQRGVGEDDGIPSLHCCLPAGKYQVSCRKLVNVKYPAARGCLPRGHPCPNSHGSNAFRGYKSVFWCSGTWPPQNGFDLTRVYSHWSSSGADVSMSCATPISDHTGH